MNMFQRLRNWWSGFRFYKDDRKPVKFTDRIKNIAFNNYRGILGFLIPLVTLTYQTNKTERSKTVKVVWIWMAMNFLLQPVAIPVTGLIPIFMFPLTDVNSTNNVTKCYFNESIALYILGSMLLLLINNSGFDRRAGLKILCSGDHCQFSGKRLVFKASAAAFLLSMISNRLLVTSALTQHVTPILLDMRAAYKKSTTEPNFDEVRYILNNAIQTSSALGSIVIVHASYGTLACKALWDEVLADQKLEYVDVFNYLQYTCFAFPTACVMWLINVCYHMLLINLVTKKAMSQATMTEVRNRLRKIQDSIPKRMSGHEMLSVFFTILSFVIFCTRWNLFTNSGWNSNHQPSTTPAPAAPGILRTKKEDQIPVVKDVVVAAMFVLLLHWLPHSLNFLKIWTADKKSQIKTMKPESGILYWRFVDTNTNYGYIFLLGSGVALCRMISHTGLSSVMSEKLGNDILGSKDWDLGLFLVVLIISLLTNVMTGVAALVSFMPFALYATQAAPWPGKLYLAALGCGIGASFGFMMPFMYTPAYFCHRVGKVPIRKMIMYSAFSVLMCMAILWASLDKYAPVLWDPETKGIAFMPPPMLGTTVGDATTDAAAAPPS